MRVRQRTRRKPALFSAIEQDAPITRKKSSKSKKRQRERKGRARVRAASENSASEDYKPNAKRSRRSSVNGGQSKSSSQRSSSPSSQAPSEQSSETTLSRASSSRKSAPVSVMEQIKGKGCTAFTFCFNLSFDPWVEYSFRLVADRGVHEHEWTSYRLRSEVLYLETESERFELKLISSDSVKDKQIKKESIKIEDKIHPDVKVLSEKTASTAFSKYVWSRVKSPEILDAGKMKELGSPLPPKHCDVLDGNLDWNQILWGSKYIQVKSKVYLIKCLHFAPIAKASNA